MKLRSWTVCTGSALCAAAISIHGCNSTSGGLISNLPVEVGGAARDAGADSPMSFTTQTGWVVELNQAVIAVGPFYFNNQPPEQQTSQSGVVIIQITSQTFVDALDPTLYSLDGGANGETGPAVSVEVDLFPPGCAGNGGSDTCGSDPTPFETYTNLISENASPDLSLFLLQSQNLASGSSAFVAGTATEPQGGGALVVPFYGFITIDESTGGNPNDPAAAPLNTLQRVSGACPCAGGCGAVGGCSLDFVTQPSVLQIRVDPTHWFDGVDFSTLIPAPPTCGDAGTGCDAGPAWSPDAGALTWNSVGTDSTFNTELVEEGLQSANGVYLFNVVPQGSN